MATTRISALTELTTPASADVLVINDDSAGSTKKIQLSNLIPDDAIDSEHYVAGSIDNEHLADDAVDSDELASGAVDIDHLSATGTASSSTFLRGDNSWVTPTDTNTTYSVQDGELSEINFTSADHTKLNAIEASADVTDATNVTAAGALMDSELAGIAAVKATTGTFLTADQTKLDGIETSATADQTAGEILTLIEDGIDSVHYVDASIDNVHLADDAVGIEELSATGTASSSTFLRGDNTWAAGGIASLLADTTPQLGGDLDLNSNDITGTGGINLTGTVETSTLNLDGTTESSPAEGDIWYDSGKFYLGTSQSFTGVWSSGGNLATARKGLAGAGTQSAGLCMGGYTDSNSNVTEEYDGTSWSSGGNLATARRYPAGAGTQSAGLCMGGNIPPSSNLTEEYDGTSWSSGGNLATAREQLTGAGTQSAGLCTGGWDGSVSNVTEEYDLGTGSYDELFTPSTGL